MSFNFCCSDLWLHECWSIYKISFILSMRLAEAVKFYPCMQEND